MDKEQKIAKIRAKVTPVKHIPRGTVETMELLFNIQFLLDELDRLRAERDSHGPEGRNYTNVQYVDLLAERNKLIEVLRWYADKTNYVQEVHHLRHGTLIGPAEAIYYDEGQRAREILKEIGVTVE